MTHTKIMATLADVRCTPAFVRSLVEAGAAGFRINSAHVGPEEIASMVGVVRAVDPSVRILMDTKGPEIRFVAPEEPFILVEGETVSLVEDDAPSTASRLCVRVPLAEAVVKPGHCLLVDDGAAELCVTEVHPDGSLLTRVVRSARIDAAKTIASTDAVLPDLPAVSARDRLNIIAAREAGIDMIAHSFVRSADDVREVRRLIDGSPIELYAKIECRRAVDNLPEILDAADALLVARGDLGTQIPLWEIPALQMRIVALCRDAGKPAMVATQILESMISSPRPTRAELSDIALGVAEGASWLLLCGETARGEYPRQCVDIMRRTVEASEKAMPWTIC